VFLLYNNFKIPTVSRPSLGPTHPPIQWTPDALFLGLARPGREAKHSPPYSTVVKHVWGYTSIPKYAYISRCSVKAYLMKVRGIQRLFLAVCTLIFMSQLRG